METKETSSCLNRKASVRNEIWRKMSNGDLPPSPQSTIPTFPGQNKASERLRSLPAYKSAKSIMVPPDQAQLQVRVNVLSDGKRLIMATPGLQDGFYLIDRQDIKAKDWTRAARSSGVRRFGQPLTTSLQEIGIIDLLATGAVAVSLQGGRIGKGSGYFDLEYAILREIGAINAITPVVALVDDLQIIDEVPMEGKDVAVDLIVTPTRIIAVERTFNRPEGIAWDMLSQGNIRGMRPLKELRKKYERES